jgi:trigger factor
MQVSVENVSKIERRLTIVVPANQVEEAYTKQMDKFAKSANIKGFRPGKAPMSYIQQRYGDDARKEALGEVIQHSLYEAIRAEKLIPVSTPQVDPKIPMANQPFEFVATFEVMPEIGTVALTIDNLEKLNVDITEEDTKRVFTQLQKQYTKWQLVDRAAEAGDRVVVDYYAIFDGVSDVENKITDFPVELGSKTMLPGFEDGLLGVKTGDEKTLKLKFPDDFGAKDRAGKPVDFVVTVKQVYHADLPPLDTKFIQQLGIKSGKQEDLTQQIKQSLELERDRLVKEKLKEQVFRQLLEQNALEVPKALVAREAKNIHDELHPQHEGHEHHHTDEENAQFNEIAQKRVALGLLIAEFAKQKDVKVNKDRVNARIREIASVYEKPDEVVEWLSSGERLGGIEAQVMEDQVLDKLMEGTPIKEKKISYAELKGIRI